MNYAELYQPVFLCLVFIMSLVQSIKIANQPTNKLLSRGQDVIGIWTVCVLFIVVVGLRPADALCFGDSESYNHDYKMMQDGLRFVNLEGHDVLFYQFMFFCSKHFSVNVFFLLIEIGYVVPIMIFCKKIFDKNAPLAMLFCLGAFSFFSYGTNGLRHGLASSFTLLAYTFWFENKGIKKTISIIPAFFAYSVHGSILLPIIVFLVVNCFPKTKFFVWFWGVSIIFSIIAGGLISSFFSSLGFADDRLSKYLSETDRFRFDFILYSVVPIIYGYIVLVKKRIKDKVFGSLFNTYVVCNAFWIMIINAEYSNRFAFLSWFLYPIVLAYPLLKLNVWKGQSKVLSYTLFGHVFFTCIMVIRDYFRYYH